MSEQTELGADPDGYKLFAALRELERVTWQFPRIGHAKHVQQDPVRLGQEPHLHFVAHEIAKVSQEGEKTRLDQYGFGLLGPNGPMPIHLTELAYERKGALSDAAIPDFLNVLQHRMIEFFYRAWADADPCANRDRPSEDLFGRFVGSAFGLGVDGALRRDSVADESKLGLAGLFADNRRSAAGLEQLLASYFGHDVEVRQFVPAWFDLPAEARLRLGVSEESATLGVGAVLGGSVWLVQQQFEIVIGPVREDRLRGYFPDGKGFEDLRALVRLYTNDEWAWHLRVRVDRYEQRGLTLGHEAMLGWSTWLGDPGGVLEDVWFRGDAPRPMARALGDVCG